jgi:hypothetical protein
VMHFRGQTTPRVGIAAVHGVLAASGLVVLLFAAMGSGTSRTAQIALGLFVVAALGGFGLLSFHLRGRRLPNGLVVGHGFLAVVAFLILALVAFSPR